MNTSLRKQTSKLLRYKDSNMPESKILPTHLFEDKAHVDRYAVSRFDSPVSIRNEILRYIGHGNANSAKTYGVVLDVGCGSGQSTTMLADVFQSVIGADKSPSQIQKASERNTYSNITYRVGSDSQLPVDDSSVDLVTVSSALHWFDQSSFYKEVRRVLKPGGSVAIWDFRDTPELTYEGKEDASQRITNNFKQLHDELWIGRAWPEMADKLVSSDYRQVPPCFNNEFRYDTTIEVCWTIDEVIAFIKTLSVHQNYKDVFPESESLVELKESFLVDLGSPETAGSTKLKVTFSLFMLMSRNN